MDSASNVSMDRLKDAVDRIENLSQQREALAEDIKVIYEELKAAGFSTKHVRKIVAERKKDYLKRKEEAYYLDLYGRAVGLPTLTELLS